MMADILKKERIKNGKEEKIPYKEELKKNGFGYRKPMYQENIIVYVPNKYKFIILNEKEIVATKFFYKFL